jgi:hypothetical protein
MPGQNGRSRKIWDTSARLARFSTASYVGIESYVVNLLTSSTASTYSYVSISHALPRTLFRLAIFQPTPCLHKRP